jgi:hypothetical protein
VAVLFYTDEQRKAQQLSEDLYADSNGSLYQYDKGASIYKKVDYISFAEGHINAGKVFIALKPEDSFDVLRATLAGDFDQSKFSFETALAHHFNLDSFEVTFLRNPADASNLTSVNWFSIPMRMWVPDNPGLTDAATAGQHGGFQPVAGGWPAAIELLAKPGDTNVFYADTRKTDLLIAASPTTPLLAGSSYAVAAYPGFEEYVKKFLSWLPPLTMDGAGKIVPPGLDQIFSISGFFNGAPSSDDPKDPNKIWHNAGCYNYVMFRDGTKVLLVPRDNIQTDLSGVSQIQGIVVINQADLAKSIIQTNGGYSVYQTIADYKNGDNYEYVTAFAGPFKKYQSVPNLGTGWNNQWGPLFADLATGFVAGYWRDPSAMADKPETFNVSSNWSYLNSAGGRQPFRASSLGFYGFDAYSALFLPDSNAYAGNYTDNLTRSLAAGSPLLTVGGANEDKNLYVSLMDVNALPAAGSPPISGKNNSDTFRDFSWNGYQPPVQLGPSSLVPSGLAEDDYTPSAFNFKIDFDGQPIILDTSAIKTISFTAAGRTPIRGPFGWGNYTIASSTTLANPVPQADGVLQFSQVPVPNVAGVTSYQVALLDAAGRSLYATTLYVTTDGKPDPSNNNSYLPLYQSKAQIVAGDPVLIAATEPWSPPATGGSYLQNVALNPMGGDPSLDPALWAYNTKWLAATSSTYVNNLAVPCAPVVWAGSGARASLPHAYSKLPPTNGDFHAGDLDSGQLTFSWLGGIPSQPLPQSFLTALAGPTNKLFPRARGQLKITDTGGAAVSSLAFVADIDGQWSVPTPAHVSLAPNMYKALITQTLAGNAIGYSDGSQKSHSVFFTIVPPPDLALQVVGGAAGPALTLDTAASPGTTGNWLSLDVSGWSDDQDTMLFYATSADGKPIARDSSTGGASCIRSATLASMGAVTTDAGRLLFQGRASIYLAAGQFLRAALLSSDGSIISTAPVSVDGAGAGATVGIGALRVMARVDNSPTAAYTLAATQKLYNEPLYCLGAGSRLAIEASGSCANTNRLSWVRIDVDPFTGGRSINGVSEAASQAFRDAVINAAPADFSIAAGGRDFATRKVITISEEGYYAPVLFTPLGRTFVIGTANPGGREQFRLFGDNSFGVEDLGFDQGSDFDYNDMVVRLSLV